MGYEAEVSVQGDANAGSSLSEDVYWQLRREIVRGDLRPNQPLAEIEIAERLNVSRTPVRESMQRLAAGFAADPRPFYVDIEVPHPIEYTPPVASWVDALNGNTARPVY